eukprot:TRINITY_DN7425_c0_g1_i1.p1 TRINITY_DN7425_c0_g1~~TRINITY_DN7425_c0_g1_i1.p1  ORF type:complete len:1168 (-),score=282.35 TRINITY_DN7425_c0_g1_i1:92-3595(-)
MSLRRVSIAPMSSTYPQESLLATAACSSSSPSKTAASSRRSSSVHWEFRSERRNSQQADRRLSQFQFQGDRRSSQFQGDRRASQLRADRRGSQFRGDRRTSQFQGDRRASQFQADRRASQFQPVVEESPPSSPRGAPVSALKSGNSRGSRKTVQVQVQESPSGTKSDAGSKSDGGGSDGDPRRSGPSESTHSSWKDEDESSPLRPVGGSDNDISGSEQQSPRDELAEHDSLPLLQLPFMEALSTTAESLYVPLESYAPESYCRWARKQRTREAQRKKKRSPTLRLPKRKVKCTSGGEFTGSRQISESSSISTPLSLSPSTISAKQSSRLGFTSERSGATPSGSESEGSRESPRRKKTTVAPPTADEYQYLTLKEITEKMEQTRRVKQPKLPVLRLFKRAMLKRYGSLAQAWREMDINGDCRLSFSEFVAACRRMSFAGNLTQIFKQLTWGEKEMMPHMVDIELPRQLQEMKQEDEKRTTGEKFWNKDALWALHESGRCRDDRFTTFDHGRKTNAQTLREVNLMLLGGSARVPPASTARQFKDGLIKKYEKLEYAWEAMDTNSDGALQFHEFVHACHRIQFQGNLRRIFDELRGDQQVLVPAALSSALPEKLKKLYAEREKETKQRAHGGYRHKLEVGRVVAAETFGEVRALLERPDIGQAARPSTTSARAVRDTMLKHYDKWEYAWEVLDRKGEGVARFHSFVAVCRALGVSGKLWSVFCELSGHPENTEDRAAVVLLPEKLDESLPKILEQRSKQLGSMSSCEVPSSLKASSSRSSSPSAADSRGFKAALLKKYDGRLDMAWVDMISNDNESLQFHEFLAACRQLHFAGNLRRVFDELARGGKEIKPEYFDVSLPSKLSKLKAEQLSGASRTFPNESTSSGLNASTTSWQWIPSEKVGGLSLPAQWDSEMLKTALVQKYGSMEYAWQELDSNDDGLLQFGEFLSGCRRLKRPGLGETQARSLFAEMAGPSGEAIAPIALDPELPSRLEQVRRHRAKRKAYVDGGKKQGLCMDTAAEVSWVLEQGLLRDKAPPPSDAKSFKAALIKKYGKLENAWEEMDYNGDGALQFYEFTSACRRIQFHGNLRKIFDELAVEGELRMEDMDPILRRAKAAAEKERARADAERRAREQERQVWLSKNMPRMSRKEVEQHNVDFATTLFKDMLRDEN